MKSDPALPPPHPTIRRATDGEKRCKRCNKSAADGAEFFKHPAFTDKLDNRCKQCRGEMRAEKKGGKVKPPAKERVSRQERAPLQTRPTPKPAVGDDDTDFDPDEEIPNPFARTPTKPMGRPAADLPRVRCGTCDESFPDAKSMGIHKTLVHFGR